MTLAELAIHIPGSIDLFEKYNFNYYQNGKQTFKNACEEKQLVFAEIDAELNQLQLSAKSSSMLTLEDMSLDRLIDFINGQHHANEEEVLDVIDTCIKTTMADAGVSTTLKNILRKIDSRFSNFKEHVLKHCEKEDAIVFPYMRKLHELRHDKTVESMSFKNPIQLLESEHIQAAEILSEIKDLTHGFLVVKDAPESYQQLMSSLKAFETDFHMHLHIENNILFPKVTELEEQLKQLNKQHHEIAHR